MLFRCAGLVVFVCGLVLLAPTATAQPLFVDEAAARGFTPYVSLPGMGAGLAAADFDDDGDVDVFVPAGQGEGHRLYRNDGAGQWLDVAPLVGLDLESGARTALWFDADGDHRLDLVLGSDCFMGTCAGGSLVRLMMQREDGMFVDATVAAGLSQAGTDAMHRSGFAAGDVNGDGCLDLVTVYWMDVARLFINQGDGTFVEETVASGMDQQPFAYHQAVLLDLDSDGLTDLFTSVDFEENRLWMNQGITDGLPTFVESAATTGCDNAMNDMGVSVGDYDDDGDPDLYVTNIYVEGPDGQKHNVLLRLDSDGPMAFSDVSDAAGVQDGGWGWGTTFLDVENDTYLDLAETNGWMVAGWAAPPRLFEHQHDDPPTFVDQAATSGLTDDSWGSSLLSFDADRDGDADLLQTVLGVGGDPSRVAVYINQLDRSSGDHRYLVVRPRMGGPNHWAIGTKVAVTVGARTQTRWILAGTSYLGQEPAEAFFGLGSASTVDRVTIDWPDGTQTVLHGVAADQVVTVNSDIFSSGFESGDTSDWSLTVN